MKGSATVVDGVTSEKFGKVAVTAVKVTEVAVAFKGTPKAVGGKMSVEVSGEVTAASFVYCYLSKTASRLRMLNTTNDTNATKPSGGAGEDWKSLSSASTREKYNVKRVETKTGALTFKCSYDKLGEGSKY